jgi:hypothetical protein
MKNFLPNFMFCAQTLRNINRCSDFLSTKPKTPKLDK